jgi:hypothetical protein
MVGSLILLAVGLTMIANKGPMAHSASGSLMPLT